MSATRRPGYFDAEPQPSGYDLVISRLDRLSDLGEWEHLSDDARELIRWAVATIALLTSDL